MFRSTYCQLARNNALSSENDIGVKQLLKLLDQSIASFETKKIIERRKKLDNLFNTFDRSQAENLLKRLQDNSDPLSRFYKCELETKYRKKLISRLKRFDRSIDNPGTNDPGTDNPVTNKRIPDIPVKLKQTIIYDPPPPIPKDSPPFIGTTKPPGIQTVNEVIEEGTKLLERIRKTEVRNKIKKLTKQANRALGLISTLTTATIVFIGGLLFVKSSGTLITAQGILLPPGSLIPASDYADILYPGSDSLFNLKKAHRLKLAFNDLEETLNQLDEEIDSLAIEDNNYNIPPEEPPVKLESIDRRGAMIRGYAVEDFHLRKLFLSEGYEKLPSFFPGIDGVKGEAEFIKQGDKIIKLYTNPDGLSIKSTNQTGYQYLIERYNTEWLPEITKKTKGIFYGKKTYGKRKVIVKGLKRKTIDLVFEEGTSHKISNETVEALNTIREHAIKKKNGGVVFRWFVIVAEEEINSIDFLKNFQLK